MPLDPIQQKQIMDILILSLEGEAGSEDLQKLKAILDISSEARDYYLKAVIAAECIREMDWEAKDFANETDSCEGFNTTLWKALADEEKNAETIEIAQPPAQETVVYQMPVQIQRRVSRMSLAAIIISTAALLLLLVYVFLNPRTPGSVVGVLTEAVDAQWQDNAMPAEAGQDLRKGSFSLQRGLVQVRFDSGARVILEGPAQVELLSGNSMYLRRGKIVATVGREAIGFVVNTPQGKVLDLGTEYGIQVNQTGQSQVHVFNGEVLLYLAGREDHLRISQGSAKAVSPDGSVADIPLQSAGFIRSEEMNSKVLAYAGNSYHRWKAWVFDIHRDPSLVAHYFYSKDTAQPTCLLNAVKVSREQSGTFGGQERAAPTWVAGRWAGKDAVRFERGKNQAIVISPDAALSINGPITISAWVYYPEEMQKGGHLISCREGNHVNFQFSVFDQHYEYEQQRNQFEFLRFNQDHTGVYSQEFIQRAGLWYHFVAAYDTKTVCFYVNGKVLKSEPYVSNSDMKATEIILGAQKLNGRYVLPGGDFDGIVDELMLFNRCLNGDEIQRIYEIGTPVSK
jgi:hypothetical protein